MCQKLQEEVQALISQLERSQERRLELTQFISQNAFAIHQLETEIAAVNEQIRRAQVMKDDHQRMATTTLRKHLRTWRTKAWPRLSAMLTEWQAVGLQRHKLFLEVQRCHVFPNNFKLHCSHIAIGTDYNLMCRNVSSKLNL